MSWLEAPLLLLPIYCIVRALVDHREERRRWAMSGVALGALTGISLLVASASDGGNSPNVNALALLLLSSLLALVHVIARIIRDIRDLRYGWAAAGAVAVVAVLVPWWITING